MKTSITSRTTDRGIKAAMITLLITLSAITYSFSQSDFHGADHPINQAKVVAKEIKHVGNINLVGKAVALNSSINSPYEDIKPALTPCGKRLYFSRSFHPNNTAGEKDAEDIWFSDYDETTDTWSDPAVLASHLNNTGPNYINNVSVTGDTVILGNQYLKKGKMRAGVSYSVNTNGQWSEPKPINILNDYNIANSSNTYVSLKSGIIIRAIQRAETHGDRDLYVSFWNGEEATEPVNMGSAINTEMEEASPFLSADGKSLYFASKGHHGYGGFDIWVSKRLDDTWTNWSEPENLGPAVNGAMDDEFFSITHCGSFAIFSKQVSVHNTDLYRISIEELFGEAIVKMPSGSKVAVAKL